MRWQQVAFRVGEEQFTWGDVAADAQRRGTWTQLEQEIRLGISCRRRARDTGLDLPADHVEAAAATFRYDRKLVSAEDMEAWLKGRDLTVAEWMGWVRRDLARRRWPHLGAEADVGDDEVASFTWVTGVCSGALKHAAYELAGRVAAQHSMTDGTWLSRDEAYQQFCSRAVSPHALEAAIATRYLDWMVIDCDWATFHDEDTAREALMCVREDGRSIAEAAAAADTTVARRRLLIEAVDAGLRPRFSSATAGDLIGPLPADGEGATIVAVIARTTPSPADDLVRRRAEEFLTAAAVEREIESRVRWVEHL